MNKLQKSTGLKTKNQTTGLKKSVESDKISMTPNEVLQKYGINAFIEVMKIVSPEWTIIPNKDGKGFEVYMNDTYPLDIDIVNITADKFCEYRRCQKSGRFNMVEYSNWKPYTTLTEDEWYQIITNYDNYLKEFEGKIA